MTGTVCRCRRTSTSSCTARRSSTSTRSTTTWARAPPSAGRRQGRRLPAVVTAQTDRAGRAQPDNNAAPRRWRRGETPAAQCVHRWPAAAAGRGSHISGRRAASPASSRARQPRADGTAPLSTAGRRTGRQPAPGEPGELSAYLSVFHATRTDRSWPSFLLRFYSFYTYVPGWRKHRAIRFIHVLRDLDLAILGQTNQHSFFRHVHSSCRMSANEQ